MGDFVKWSEIENFHTLRKSIRGEVGKITYRAKVKLHGTNAAVRVNRDGTVKAMKRTQVITSQNDNQGFAAWVESVADEFKKCVRPDYDIVFHGEWCGPGVQKGVAIGMIPKKIFAIFAVRCLVDESPENPFNDVMFTDWNIIGTLMADAAFDEKVHVLPWHDEESIEIDWNASAEDLVPVLEKINGWVAKVEECDPWVERVFGIKGVGEGLVFYPIDNEHRGYKGFHDFGFKAKGIKHQVVAHTKPAQMDPTVAENINELVGIIVTENRMRQGAESVRKDGEPEFSMKNMGDFLKFMNDDLKKECAGEIEASGLVDQRMVLKVCSDFARNWYAAESKKL